MFLAKLRRKFFPLQITKRIYLWIAFLLVVPVTALSLLTYAQFFQLERQKRIEQLFSVASEMDLQFEALYGSFQNILDGRGASGRPQQEQSQVLNAALQPILDKISLEHPDVGLGYYCVDLDRVVAAAPSPEPPPEAAKSHTNQYFEPYATGKPELFTDNQSLNWPGARVLALSYPMYYRGRIIGYSWVNIKTGDIYAAALAQASKIILTGGALVIGIFILSWLFLSRLKRELECFSRAVATNSSDLTRGVLPELNPLLELIKERNSQLSIANELLQAEITGHKAAEAGLLRMAYIVESSSDAIIGSMEGQIISWNSGAEKIFGYTAGEAIGRHISLLVPEGNQAEVERIRQRLKQGERISQYEAMSVTKDGKPINVSLTMSQIKDGAGDIVGVSTIARDITERKGMEKDIARLERLNLVGEMAAGIGHEIRNPMTTVRGFLQLLTDKEEFLRYREYFDIMISELDRANVIISEFLSLAKDKAIELQSQDLNRIVNVIAPLIEADALFASKTLKLQLAQVPALPLSEKEIRQVILNLARNGLEAMQPGGELTIKTYIDGNDVVLAVQDQGKGIESGLLDKIGTPFFTTKDQGTGLGLAVCYSIVARHGAAIKVKTGLSGSTFLVRFKAESRESKAGSLGLSSVNFMPGQTASSA